VPEESPKALSSAVRATSGATLVSRLAGLAREVLTVRIFGDTAIGSAFAAGFQVPNLFRRLFGEGALSAAFIPEYTQLVKRDQGDPARPADRRLADAFASLVITTLLLATTALTLIIELGLLIALLTLPHNADRTLSLGLIMTMLPYMPLVCTAAIMGGMLQVHGKFAAASAGPLLMNAMVVAMGLYFLFTNQLGSPRTAYILGIVIVASGFAQCFWFAKLLRPHVRWTRLYTEAREAGGRTLRKFTPAAIGLGSLQLNTLCDTVLAMLPVWGTTTILGFAYPLDEKSNVLISGAARLYQFPLGVFGIAVATAIFPLLSRHADEPAHFIQTLRRGIRLSLFIGVPASIGLFLVRHEAIAVPYSGGGKGGFSADGVARCAAVLGGFALAVWAYSLNHVLTRAFYARGDTKTPMRVSLVMVACNISLNLTLIWPCREAGLGYSTAICAALQCTTLLILSRRFATPGHTILDHQTISAIAQILLAAAAMAAAVWLAGRFIPRPAGWTGELVALTTKSVIGIIAFVAASQMLGCHELGWLFQRKPQQNSPQSHRDAET
jgi:putative peptidoglycan lipid II flippase